MHEYTIAKISTRCWNCQSKLAQHHTGGSELDNAIGIGPGVMCIVVALDDFAGWLVWVLLWYCPRH